MQLNSALIGLLSIGTFKLADAQIVTTEGSATELVENLLAPSPFLSFSNAVLVGNPACARMFMGGASAVPNGDFPDSGIVISTGDPESLHLQSTDRQSTAHGSPGDADLDALVDGETVDACVLSFDFECTRDPCPISFEYVWGSEEYNEFVGGPFNDVFAWLLNGDNIAFVPGTNQEVSIETINNVVNAQYFNDNDPSDTNIPYPLMEADGFTTTLMATGNAVPGTNTMKLVIADRSDATFDSWALFKTSSFTFNPIGGGGGDPHFTRWAQDKRDTFHGECDLVVMHSDKFHNEAGLDFHIRTTILNDMFSYIESAAVRVGKNVVEVHNGKIVLNNVEYTDEDLHEGVIFGGDDAKKTYKLYLAKGAANRRVYRLNLDNDTEIEFKFYKHYMTFELIGHTDFSDVTGMLGKYPTGLMLSRDGKEMKSFEDYGFEWQVNHEDPVLFGEAREPQLPYEVCRLPSTSAQSSRRQLRGENPKLFAAAQEACADIHGSNFNLCVTDVLMTGDVEMAKEW